MYVNVISRTGRLTPVPTECEADGAQSRSRTLAIQTLPVFEARTVQPATW
jgi:hypothetical protein